MPSIGELFTVRVPPALLLAKFIEHPTHARSFPHIVAHAFAISFMERQVPGADASQLVDRAAELLKANIIGALDDPATSNISLEVRGWHNFDSQFYKIYTADVQ